MDNFKNEVVDFLKNSTEEISEKTATIGFDAFVDKIVRPVKFKDPEGKYVFFNDIGEFGNHIVSKSGKSCGIELFERMTKLGGNAPIFSNSLGELGVNVKCIAPLGFPVIDSIFQELSHNVKLYTVGNPGYTNAVEFNDGKIMLSERASHHKLEWSDIKKIVSINHLVDYFTKCSLVGMVNWNAIDHFNEIFEGILRDILRGHAPIKGTSCFIDLADISEQSPENITTGLKLVSEFNDYYTVILGLNENEALLVYKAVFPKQEIPELKEVGNRLYSVLNIDKLVIHTLKDSLAWDKDGTAEIPSLFVNVPKLSTGGGDNFNGGLCFGFLLGLDIKSSMLIANAVSGYYVRNGHSPNIENLIDTINSWDELIEY